MGADLVVYERALEPALPMFRDLLRPVGLPVETFARSVMVSIERLPALGACSMESIINGAVTFAVLGLTVDGATGQGFLIPFKGRAQPVIGYKGFNTLGHRAGLTITGGVVREGDAFDWEEGSNAFVRHRPSLGDRGDMKAAWACATAPGRSPIIAVLRREDILAIKVKSPGARKPDSPWNDPTIGFFAMAEKSAKRRLARSLPIIQVAPQFQMAASLDEAHEERGAHAYLRSDGALIVDDKAAAIDPGDDERLLAPPRFEIEMANGRIEQFPTAERWRARWMQIMEHFAGRPEPLLAYRERNLERLKASAGEGGADIDAELLRQTSSKENRRDY